MGTNFTYEQFNALVRQPAVARQDSYLNAPLYYVLTGRKGVWVHEGYGAVLVVCQHPNVADRLLVFPEIGHADGKLAASVLCSLEAPANGIQLARFDDDDIRKLKEALSHRNASTIDRIETIAEEVLDWRYPVHILDTALVASLEGAPFVKIRNKCRKVEGLITAIPLSDPQSLRAMRAAQKYWEGSMIFRDMVHNAEVSSFYTTLFSLIEHSPDLFGGRILFQGNRPVGFTVYDQPFMGTANLLASLGDSSVAGLADYQVVETCRALAADGVRRLNFGGSESQSLDAFKRKFQPCQSIPLQSAEVHYAAQQDINIRSGMLTMGYAPS